MDNFIRKNIGSRPKNVIKEVFLGFPHNTAQKRFAILLFCSDYAQTYRVVAHFKLEGGKTKSKPQNGNQFLFTNSGISSDSWS